MMSTEGMGKTPDPRQIPQFKAGTIVLMFLWPAAWFTLLIYGVLS
jgi:hypothetical protein